MVRDTVSALVLDTNLHETLVVPMDAVTKIKGDEVAAGSPVCVWWENERGNTCKRWCYGIRQKDVEKQSLNYTLHRG